MSEDEKEKLAPWQLAQDVDLVTAALKLAVRDALRAHKRAGCPIAVWQDGKVLWIAAEDIPVDLDPRSDQDPE